MNIINGDLLQFTEGVIIHQVNNRRVMGAGVAKSIATKYPMHKQDYLNSKLDLGSIVITKLSNKFAILGLVAQNGYGRDSSHCYTDYEALKDCLMRIAYWHKLNPTVKYYVPYGIGCGLANGNWNTVSGLIDTYAPFIIAVKLA